MVATKLNTNYPKKKNHNLYHTHKFYCDILKTSKFLSLECKFQRQFFGKNKNLTNIYKKDQGKKGRHNIMNEKGDVSVDAGQINKKGQIRDNHHNIFENFHEIDKFM